MEGGDDQRADQTNRAAVTMTMSVTSGRIWLLFSVKRENRGGLTDAEVPALVEAGAALGAPPVHGPHATPVRRLVADPANTGRHVRNQEGSLPWQRF